MWESKDRCHFAQATLYYKCVMFFLYLISRLSSCILLYFRFCDDLYALRRHCSCWSDSNHSISCRLQSLCNKFYCIVMCWQLFLCESSCNLLYLHCTCHWVFIPRGYGLLDLKQSINQSIIPRGMIKGFMHDTIHSLKPVANFHLQD